MKTKFLYQLFVVAMALVTLREAMSWCFHLPNHLSYDFGKDISQSQKQEIIQKLLQSPTISYSRTTFALAAGFADQNKRNPELDEMSRGRLLLSNIKINGFVDVHFSYADGSSEIVFLDRGVALGVTNDQMGYFLWGLVTT